MRKLIAFPCEGETLVGSLDHCVPAKAGTQSREHIASGPRLPPSREHNGAGLLIVSGGNEIRAGAHRGMATLAAQVAAAGFPVFRFDRRGVGDSTGENRGFRASAPDLAAAVAAFRAEAGVTRVIGFGNCDAASALALFGRQAGVEALILANPYVVEPTDDLPPPAAIRARYAERLRDPAAWRRLARGRVSLAKLARGLARLARPAAAAQSDVLAAVTAWGDAATVILATRDATALVYSDAARDGERLATVQINTASHSFADVGEALAVAVLNAVPAIR